MKRVLTPSWLACHGLAAGLVAGMLAMASWQFTRATGGNALSWGYTAQWPVFAGFVGVIWWREVRRTLRAGRPTTRPVRTAQPARTAGDHPAPPVATRRPVITRRVARAGAVEPDPGDPELAAYNRYLAWLSRNPGARPVDYPG